MGWERHAVTQVATGASCIDAGPIPVGTAAVLAHEQQRAGCQRMARTAASHLRCHGRPIGVCQGRECDDGQPSCVMSSSERIRTKATDADTTVFVSIGARSGGIRSRGWYSRIWRPPWR